MHYLINPEVAGGLGPQTQMDRSVHPPRVSVLHYEVIDWLGDCIVQTFPVFLVARTTAKRLETAALTGFRQADAIVTASDEFAEFNPSNQPPDLVWLQVDGNPGTDDFGLTNRAELVVSEAALAALRTDKLEAGSVTLWQHARSSRS